VCPSPESRIETFDCEKNADKHRIKANPRSELGIRIIIILLLLKEKK